MNKLVDKERLDKAAKALNKIIKDLTNNERERAIAAEELLEAAIENTTQMFGGKSIRYVTQEQFNAMTEEEQNDPIITYFIIDAEDLSHTHNNKDLLDNFGARTLTVGNSGKTFDGSENLSWTLNEIGAAPVEHIHDDKYYTETEVDKKIEDLNVVIDTKLDTNVATTHFIQSVLSQEGEIYDSHTLYKGEKIISPLVNTNTVIDDDGTTLTAYLSYFDTSINSISAAIGNGDQLLTDAKDSVVNCINELQTEINDLENDKADRSELFSGDYNDLENKPCYDTREFETISSPVVFNGDLTDKTVVNITPGVSTMGAATDVMFYFVKISDTVPVINGELFNFEATVFDTYENEISTQTQNPYVDNNDSYINFSDSIIFVYSESAITTSIGDECTLTPGIWFYGMQADGHEIYVKNYNMTFLLEGELKQLPSQFVDYMPGKKLEGETFVVSIAQTSSDGYPEQVDNVERIAGEGSEIFNDYENNKATGEFSHSEGTETMAVETGAHAEGVGTKALGYAAHAEGNQTSALGNGSHSEGIRSIAIGGASHAEGYETEANGERGHTEGGNTKTARGTYYGHAEGYYTEANGQYASHAEGYYTKASSSYQHVQGKYNIEDAANTYAHIVGNGTSTDNRKNAHTLDWNGNAWFQGNVSVDGTPTNDNDLTTKKYVDDQINTSLNNLKLIQMTQTEYDALTTKEPNTLYIITE